MDGRRDLESRRSPSLPTLRSRAVLCWLAGCCLHRCCNAKPRTSRAERRRGRGAARRPANAAQESDGEGADERKQIKTLEAARVRLQELKNSLDEGA